MRRCDVALIVALLCLAAASQAAAQAGAPSTKTAALVRPMRQTLASKGSPLCETAGSLPWSPGIAPGPGLTLIQENGRADWVYQDALQVPKAPVTAAAIKALVCIKETHVPDSRKYSDGAASFALEWSVHVLSWPEGKLLRRRSFKIAPPGVKSKPGPGIGERPVEELAGLLDHVSIVGNIQLPLETHFAKADFSSDGSVFAVVSENTLTVWDVASGAVKQRIRPPSAEYYYLGGMAISPDGKNVLTEGNSKAGRFLSVWDVATGTETHRMAGSFPNNLQQVGYSPDGRLIAAAIGRTFDIKMWEAASGKELRVLTVESEPPGGLDFLSFGFAGDGLTLATRSRKIIRVWDVDSGTAKKTLEATEPVDSVALSADARLLASTHPRPVGGAVVLWDTASGARLRELVLDTGASSVAFSPSGRLLAIGGYDSFVYVFDVTTGKALVKLGGHADAAGTLRFSADATRLFSTADDGALKIWNAKAAGLPAR